MSTPWTLALVVNQQRLIVNVLPSTGARMSIRARNGQVEVQQPRWASRATVEAFARAHGARFLDVAHVQAARFYSWTEQFILVWGKPVRFTHLAAATPLRIVERKGQLFALGAYNDEASFELAVETFARKVLTAYLKVELARQEALMGTSRHAVRVTTKSTNWATNVLKTRTLIFNTNLFFYDRVATSYVVVHELAHDFHPHHGASFWTFVALHAPGYQAARQILRSRPDLVDDEE